ncbi:MAG: aminotransferase class I/II-fold pyridoxal phosphate-dependent enzyme [Pseudomonadota bacterium]
METNPTLSQLPDYPFPRLRALLADHPPGHTDIIDLTLGAPRHPPPEFIRRILAKEFDSFGKYPPIAGSTALKQAILAWVERRYECTLAPAQILPLVGTREGLFMLAQLCARPGRDHVLLPNPFYPAYHAAALFSNAKAVLLDCTETTGFLPDLNAVPGSIYERTALFYLCSPSNPQGAAADRAYFEQAIALARQYDFLLVVDECYADIWTQQAPLGALQVAATNQSNVVVVHSLSKRSNVPGLRSGFIAGDPSIIKGFEKLRSFGGPTMPLPVQAASAACWEDMAHVEGNRRLYDAKFSLAEDMLGITRPDGGFFLWLPVEDDEKTAVKLWTEHGVRILPGQYLASDSEKGQNPGRNYIRIALVDTIERTKVALERIAPLLAR